jgi:hypothetical protein
VSASRGRESAFRGRIRLIETVRVPEKAVTMKGHESGTRGLETVEEAVRRECLQQMP